MKYHILDNFTVKQYKPIGEEPILIRLLNPDYLKLGMPYKEDYEERYNQVLTIYVDDFHEDNELARKRFVIFDISMAQQIKDFVKQNKFDELVVHCSYGTSRSPAVAIGAAYYLEDIEGITKLRNNNRFTPNQLIIDKMLSI